MNKEQQKSFQLFLDSYYKHADHLRCYIAGEAGTGKSLIITVIKEFLQKQNKKHELQIVAPTGVASQTKMVNNAYFFI